MLQLECPENNDSFVTGLHYLVICRRAIRRLSTRQVRITNGFNSTGMSSKVYTRVWVGDKYIR